MSCIALIATLVLGQGGRVNIPLESYKLPILGGQREIALGPVIHKLEFLPHFGLEVTGEMSNQQLNQKDNKAWLSEGGRRVLNYSEKAIGQMTYTVKLDSYEGKNCMLIETDSRYQQSVKHQVYGWVQLVNRAKTSYWVKEDGTILRQISQVSLANGDWYMDAVFLSDAIALLRRNPKGESQVTLHPACGMAALHEMFKPMIVDGKVVMTEKTFYALDPMTAAPVKYTARTAGKFGGTWSNMRFEGNTIQILGPKTDLKALISYEGELMKIELPNDEFLHINSVPDEKPTKRHKDFGGN